MHHFLDSASAPSFPRFRSFIWCPFSRSLSVYHRGLCSCWPSFSIQYLHSVPSWGSQRSWRSQLMVTWLLKHALILCMMHAVGVTHWTEISPASLCFNVCWALQDGIVIPTRRGTLIIKPSHSSLSSEKMATIKEMNLIPEDELAETEMGKKPREEEQQFTGTGAWIKEGLSQRRGWGNRPNQVSWVASTQSSRLVPGSLGSDLCCSPWFPLSSHGCHLKWVPCGKSLFHLSKQFSSVLLLGKQWLKIISIWNLTCLT